MKSVLLFLFLVLSSIRRMDSKDIYLITTPNVLLSEAMHKFNIFVSSDVALIIESIHPSSQIMNRTNIFVLQRGHKSIPYFIPFIGSHLGTNLELRFLADKCPSVEECQSLTNVKGTFINESRNIDILVDNFIIFSETDKPIYKPGEVVKLRAMAIYPTNLMLEPPSTGQYVEILYTNGKYHSVPTVRSQRTNFGSITIETPDNMKMAQWRNVSFENAMKLNFTLTKDPIYGKWKITTILGLQKETAYFEVKKYVLPRFTVDLIPPSVILLSDKNIKVKVCASYSTGKNMEALIKGELCLTMTRKICRPFSSIINGTNKCNEISIDSQPFGLGGKNKIYYSSGSAVTVLVTEYGTSHQVTKTAIGSSVKWTLYEISLTSKKYFKPGLPYFGTLKLLRHDGTPQKNTTVLISIDGNYRTNYGFQEYYTSNDAGTINFIIPYIEVRSKLSLNIKGMPDTDMDGMSPPSSYQSLSNWESVDNEYIQISSLKQAIKCPGKVQIQLLTNGDISSIDIYAQMISRGLINKIIEYPPVPFKCVSRDDHLGHYKCSDNNKLICLKGWKGGNCREPVCESGCGKGACINPNHCICKTGWKGKSCETCLVADYCVNGYCMYGNDCQCKPGWRGYKCDMKGPKIHQYKEITQPTFTTQAPKPEPKYQNQTIFERYIDIPLDKNMGPDLHIVVYYINSDNEIIADSLEIVKDLNNCSHVGGGKFKFNKDKVNPGENIGLSIDPATSKKMCAVKISDVALAQFGESSNINLDFLITKLIYLNHKVTKWSNQGYGRRTCLQRRKRRLITLPGSSELYDSMKVFSQSGLYAITNGRIINAKCRYYPIMFENRLLLGALPPTARLNYQTSPEYATYESPVLDNIEVVKKQIREFFPETWVFDYYRVTPSQINLIVPDSMTTWEANAFCMTERGLWIAPSRYLTVILPFFADVYVPYSIKTGEKLQLPVKLFNYVDECYEIRADIKVNINEIKISGPQSFTVCVCENDVKTIYFNIEAKLMGKLNVTVMAQSQQSSFCSSGSKSKKNVNLSDNIRRQLLVEPPGIQSETTFSELICNNKEVLGIKSSFSIPSKIVPGSLRSYLVYNGDVMGQTFDNLDRLVRMPYGCGEQNMVALVPSIYVLDYLTNLNIEDKILTEKAKKYILDGYKRQLTYKHDDGSYSAFGKSDKNGNTWLTAFVVRSFTDAEKYVTIDKTTLKQSVQYLENMQQSNGCFKEQGTLLSGTMAGGLKNKGKTDESLLTAYVLISLNNTKTSKLTLNISKAIDCIKTGLKVKNSSYDLALSGYAFSLYEPESEYTLKIINQLQNKTVTSGRYKYWKSGFDSATIHQPVNSADVETTGYALLALQNYQTLAESLRTIYWLSNQRNSLGGYYSTQDTIVALKAISVYAQMIGVSSFEGVFLDVVLDNDMSHKDFISKSNRFITRKVSLGPKDISYVSIKTNGTGCISVQLVSLYNIEKLFTAKEEFKINVKASFTNVKSCTDLEIRICSSYLRKDRNSNMILITIDFPSGWQLTNEGRKDLVNQIITPLKRIDFMENKMHLYYDSFSYAEEVNERCLTFLLNQRSKVDNLKSSFVRMVDYYKPEIYVDSSYEVPIKTCEVKNTTRPTPSEIILCPKCVNDSEESVYDFQSKICPWSFTGLIKSGNYSLKNRLFYESKQQVFFEWTVDLEPANCTCLKSWKHINEDFVMISSQWLWLNEKLTFSNTSTLFPRNVAYKAYKSDLSRSCLAANQFSLMMSRLFPNFQNDTSVQDDCPDCILMSNLYYKVKNISEFICSNSTRWSLTIDLFNNSNIVGSITNNLNETLIIEASFPMQNCFCLQQLHNLDKIFEIIDVGNTILYDDTKTNAPLQLLLDSKFKIVEKNIFNLYKTLKC